MAFGKRFGVAWKSVLGFPGRASGNGCPFDATRSGPGDRTEALRAPTTSDSPTPRGRAPRGRGGGVRRRQGGGCSNLPVRSTSLRCRSRTVALILSVQPHPLSSKDFGPKSTPVQTPGSSPLRTKRTGRPEELQECPRESDIPPVPAVPDARDPETGCALGPYTARPAPPARLPHIEQPLKTREQTTTFFVVPLHTPPRRQE